MVASHGIGVHREKEVCDNGVRGVRARGKIKKSINLCDDGVD